MRRLAVLAAVVVSALMPPPAASGQDYSFGDWARDQGYSPGDVMPTSVHAQESGIDDLDGIGDFDWTTTPTTSLWLDRNWLSSIERGDFSGLTNLTFLNLSNNQILSIEQGDFLGLTNLTTLELYGSQISSIEPGDFDGLANLTSLSLWFNQISSIEPGDFSELTNLTRLNLTDNQISSIEPGDFSELTNLTRMNLSDNQLSNIARGTFRGLIDLELLLLHENPFQTLNLEEADLLNLAGFNVLGCHNITSVSLRDAAVNQMSLASLVDGGRDYSPFAFQIGIGPREGITDMDLSGIDFVDITDLSPLFVMDGLTDLWFVNTQNVDATALDLLLDNLATIEGADTEGILYMTQTDFDAFNAAGGGLLAVWDAEPGHHVEYLSIGDVNHDSEVNGLDVDEFTRVLLASRFDVAADMNGDGVVNGLDVDPFVEAVVAGGAQAVPESSTLLLTLIALGVLCGWRKWRG